MAMGGYDKTETRPELLPLKYGLTLENMACGNRSRYFHRWITSGSGPY